MNKNAKNFIYKYIFLYIFIYNLKKFKKPAWFFLKILYNIEKERKRRKNERKRKISNSSLGLFI